MPDPNDWQSRDEEEIARRAEEMVFGSSFGGGAPAPPPMSAFKDIQDPRHVDVRREQTWMNTPSEEGYDRVNEQLRAAAEKSPVPSGDDSYSRRRQLELDIKQYKDRVAGVFGGVAEHPITKQAIGTATDVGASLGSGLLTAGRAAGRLTDPVNPLYGMLGVKPDTTPIMEDVKRGASDLGAPVGRMASWFNTEPIPADSPFADDPDKRHGLMHQVLGEAGEAAAGAVNPNATPFQRAVMGAGAGAGVGAAFASQPGEIAPAMFGMKAIENPAFAAASRVAPKIESAAGKAIDFMLPQSAARSSLLDPRHGAIRLPKVMPENPVERLMTEAAAVARSIPKLSETAIEAAEAGILDKFPPGDEYLTAFMGKSQTERLGQMTKWARESLKRQGLVFGKNERPAVSLDAPLQEGSAATLGGQMPAKQSMIDVMLGRSPKASDAGGESLLEPNTALELLGDIEQPKMPANPMQSPTPVPRSPRGATPESLDENLLEVRSMIDALKGPGGASPGKVALVMDKLRNSLDDTRVLTIARDLGVAPGRTKGSGLAAVEEGLAKLVKTPEKGPPPTTEKGRQASDELAVAARAERMASEDFRVSEPNLAPHGKGEAFEGDLPADTSPNPWDEPATAAAPSVAQRTPGAFGPSGPQAPPRVTKKRYSFEDANSELEGDLVGQIAAGGASKLVIPPKSGRAGEYERLMEGLYQSIPPSMRGKIFKAGPESNIDEVAQQLRDRGLLDANASDDDVLQAIVEGVQSRQSLVEQRNSANQAEWAFGKFNENVAAPTRGKTAIDASKLQPGDSFVVQGQRFEVLDPLRAAEERAGGRYAGRQRVGDFADGSVLVDGGERFGVQELLGQVHLKDFKRPTPQPAAGMASEGLPAQEGAPHGEVSETWAAEVGQQPGAQQGIGGPEGRQPNAAPEAVNQPTPGQGQGGPQEVTSPAGSQTGGVATPPPSIAPGGGGPAPPPPQRMPNLSTPPPPKPQEVAGTIVPRPIPQRRPPPIPILNAGKSGPESDVIFGIYKPQIDRTKAWQPHSEAVQELVARVQQIMGDTTEWTAPGLQEIVAATRGIMEGRPFPGVWQSIRHPVRTALRDFGPTEAMEELAAGVPSTINPRLEYSKLHAHVDDYARVATQGHGPAAAFQNPNAQKFADVMRGVKYDEAVAGELAGQVMRTADGVIPVTANTARGRFDHILNDQLPWLHPGDVDGDDFVRMVLAEPGNEKLTKNAFWESLQKIREDPDNPTSIEFARVIRTLPDYYTDVKGQRWTVNGGLHANLPNARNPMSNLASRYSSNISRAKFVEQFGTPDINDPRVLDYLPELRERAAADLSRALPPAQREKALHDFDQLVAAISGNRGMAGYTFDQKLGPRSLTWKLGNGFLGMATSIQVGLAGLKSAAQVMFEIPARAPGWFNMFRAVPITAAETARAGLGELFREIGALTGSKTAGKIGDAISPPANEVLAMYGEVLNDWHTGVVEGWKSIASKMTMEPPPPAAGLKAAVQHKADVLRGMDSATFIGTLTSIPKMATDRPGRFFANIMDVVAARMGSRFARWATDLAEEGKLSEGAFIRARRDNISPDMLARLREAETKPLNIDELIALENQMASKTARRTQYRLAGPAEVHRSQNDTQARFWLKFQQYALGTGRQLEDSANLVASVARNPKLSAGEKWKGVGDELSRLFIRTLGAQPSGEINRAIARMLGREDSDAEKEHLAWRFMANLAYANFFGPIVILGDFVANHGMLKRPLATRDGKEQPAFDLKDQFFAARAAQGAAEVLSPAITYPLRKAMPSTESDNASEDDGTTARLKRAIFNTPGVKAAASAALGPDAAAELRTAPRKGGGQSSKDMLRERLLGKGGGQSSRDELRRSILGGAEIPKRPDRNELRRRILGGE